MWNMLWPVLVVVGANTIYNISTKSTPANVNAFASLAMTYVMAALSSVVLFFLTSDSKNLLAELAKTNWTAYALGIAIIGLEFGYICIYRAGWKIGVASLVANISLACVLLVVGYFFYKEVITLKQLLGMGVCAIGLMLIVK
ncbi:MAG: EamA family transporter [Phascolarctobacterium sp.]|nr:EamA family transporter [Phascolarctobacterium sp.]MBR2139256.1 EamA family transporter [Phascolarctobacterium sp.]MBR6635845.1 EamA family transporter [Phascolarctobacterium sp.]